MELLDRIKKIEAEAYFQNTFFPSVEASERCSDFKKQRTIFRVNSTKRDVFPSLPILDIPFLWANIGSIQSEA